MFGRRADGRVLKKIDPIIALTPYLMPMRCDAQVFLNYRLDYEKMARYIVEQGANGHKLTFMELIIAAFVRTVSEMPEVNRFVVNKRLYARTQLTVSFALLLDTGNPDDIEENTVKCYFDPRDTIFDVADRVREINPDVRVQAVPEFLTEENAVGLMEGTDIVMDALDNVDSRYILEDAAAEAGLTIVHGAICGWDLQVMLIPPGSGMIHRLYPAGSQAASKTSLAITPAVCAAFQASMAVRYLCGCASDSDRDLFVGSLRDLSFEAVHLRD